MSRTASGFIPLCFCKEQSLQDQSPGQEITCPLGKGRLKGRVDEQHSFPFTSPGGPQTFFDSRLSHSNPPFIPSSQHPKKASAELRRRNGLFLMSHVKEMWAALFGYHKQKCCDKRQIQGPGFPAQRPLPFPCALCLLSHLACTPTCPRQAVTESNSSH